MRRVKRFFKISIVLAAFIKVTSCAYANELQFKPYDNQIIQNQLKIRDNEQIKQPLYLMTITAEKKQEAVKEMDAKTRASISNIIGSCVQRNANIGALAGRNYNDLLAEINFQLDIDGKILGKPTIIVTGADEIAREAYNNQILKTLYICEKEFQKLPKEYYNQWHDLKLNVKFSG